MLGSLQRPHQNWFSQDNFKQVTRCGHMLPRLAHRSIASGRDQKESVLVLYTQRAHVSIMKVIERVGEPENPSQKFCELPLTSRQSTQCLTLQGRQTASVKTDNCCQQEQVFRTPTEGRSQLRDHAK